MAKYFRNKHFQGESYCRNIDYTVRSVRLSRDEEKILYEMYPGKSLSFAIRSCIHFCWENAEAKKS